MKKNKSIIVVNPDDTFSEFLEELLMRMEENIYFQSYTDGLNFLEANLLSPDQDYVFILHSYAGSFRSSQLIDEIQKILGQSQGHKIIITSDDFVEAEAIEVFDKGGDYYLVKPINLNIFVALLKKLLREG